MTAHVPSVIVLAGPNGAGQTTASRTLLAERLKVANFVNADVIAQGLAAFDPESVAVEAGRVMLEHLHALASQRADFAFETTLAGRGYARWLMKLRQDDYSVQLVYFWLTSADLAVARVAQRVAAGGPHIPEGTIRQRYSRSVRNFFRLYRAAADSWEVYDNSEGVSYRPIAFGHRLDDETVLDAVTWRRMQEGIDE